MGVYYEREAREHMVQDKGTCGDKSKRGNYEVQVQEMRMMMREKALVLHKDQDRDHKGMGIREEQEECPRKE